MPKWGLAMKEGSVVKWLKEVGDEIKKGDPFVEIETEKVVNELHVVLWMMGFKGLFDIHSLMCFFFFGKKKT